MYCVEIKEEAGCFRLGGWGRDDIKLRFETQEEASFYHIPRVEHSRQRNNLYFNACVGVWRTHKELPNTESLVQLGC